MLMLDLKSGDCVTVNGPAEIVIRECRHDRVRLEIEAEPQVKIERPGRNDGKERDEISKPL